MDRLATTTWAFGPVTVTVDHRADPPAVVVWGDRGGVCGADKETAAAWACVEAGLDWPAGHEAMYLDLWG